MMTCERCRATQSETECGLYDYCATCSKNLCPTCMAKGCCGKVPAESGQNADYVDPDFGPDDEE